MKFVGLHKTIWDCFFNHLGVSWVGPLLLNVYLIFFFRFPCLYRIDNISGPRVINGPQNNPPPLPPFLRSFTLIWNRATIRLIYTKYLYIFLIFHLCFLKVILLIWSFKVIDTCTYFIQFNFAFLPHGVQ